MSGHTGEGGGITDDAFPARFVHMREGAIQREKADNARMDEQAEHAAQLAEKYPHLTYSEGRVAETADNAGELIVKLAAERDCYREACERANLALWLGAAEDAKAILLEALTPGAEAAG